MKEENSNIEIFDQYTTLAESIQEDIKEDFKEEIKEDFDEFTGDPWNVLDIVEVGTEKKV